MGYSIKVLSNEEFDELPYRHSKEALGVADPETKTAYVRHTSHPELQKYLINHEFDHFVEEHPTDEIEGVRYKIPNFLSSAASGIGSAFSKGISGIGSGIKNVASGAASAGGNVMDYLNPFGSSNRMSGTGINQAFQNVAKPATNALSQFGGGTQKSAITPSQPQGERSIFSQFLTPQNLLGAGALGIGLMKGLPKAPSLMTPQIQGLQSQISQGGSPLGQQAHGVISQNLGKEFSPLTDAEITAATANLDKSRLMDLKRLEGVYASSRPGTDYTTDTNYKQDQALIEQQYAEAKANQVANRTRSAEDSFNTNQSRNIQQALGASDQQMQQLMEIAQLDIAQIMTQLNLDYQKALLFKQTFLQLGADLISPPSPFEQFVSQQSGGNQNGYRL